MSIKRILVPLPGSVEHSAGEIDLALSATKALDAHVEALFISAPPPTQRVGAEGGVIGYRTAEMGAVTPADYYAREREKNAMEARERFTKACAANGLPVVQANTEPHALPAASWSEIEGSYVEAATRRAAAFDLMVAASGAVVEALKAIAEQSLLVTRRPVLLAPTRMQTALSDPAMIAWDESPECWHAVSAAVPFLRLAKEVKIISVDREETGTRRTGLPPRRRLLRICVAMASWQPARSSRRIYARSATPCWRLQVTMASA